jgi:hypothetical protein
MQAHVAKEHRIHRLKLCNCDLDRKYCSKLVPFCHQILRAKVWLCVPYVPPETEVQAIVRDRPNVWDGPYRQPTFRIVYKGLPYDKIYAPPPLLSPIRDPPVEYDSYSEEYYGTGSFQ